MIGIDDSDRLLGNLHVSHWSRFGKWGFLVTICGLQIGAKYKAGFEVRMDTTFVSIIIMLLLAPIILRVSHAYIIVLVMNELN